MSRPTTAASRNRPTITASWRPSSGSDVTMVAGFVDSQASPVAPPVRAARTRPPVWHHLFTAFWFAVLPAVFAWLVVRYLVPPVLVGDNEVMRDACRLA